MQIPNFPACDHELLQPLTYLSDYDLVDNLQRSPSEGKYFTALFCRYSPVVYSLTRHSARSPVQADYLFALTWRLILNELGGIDLSNIRAQRQSSSQSNGQPNGQSANQPDRAAAFSLQGWLINLTAAHINQVVLPDVESIHYSLSDAPPPLWCYTERALENLSPLHRLIVLMAQTFAWSSTRISAYLQAEGDRLTPDEVQFELQRAYRALEKALPADIRALYIDDLENIDSVENPTLAPSPSPEVESEPLPKLASKTEDAQGQMTIEFDEMDLQV